jgi:Tfp pilus assembly protein FimV
LNKPSFLIKNALGLCAVLILVLGSAPSVTFAETAAPSGMGRSYTVAPGDTLDKVIHKFYPGSPLKIEVLRAAITEQNRGAFTKGDQKVLMAGAMINLPDQMEVANSVLEPKSTKASTESSHYKGENGLGADTSNVHRNWVRFP